MTVYTGSDGLTYTFENNELVIEGSGETTALSAGILDGTHNFKSMTSVTVGEGITILSERAFQECFALVSASLPSTLTYMRHRAFNHCTSLQQIKIPKNVAQIDEYAFNNTYSMTAIYFDGNQPIMATGSFRLGVDYPATATVYSKGWASSSVFTSTIIGSDTTLSYVTGVVATYSHLLLNSKKIQVDSAIRDGNGLKIDVSYQKKNVIVSNTSVSSWVSDNTYADYPYRASIAITGVTANDTAEVVFAVAQATSGDYAPVCETYAGGVYVYSAVNDTITIPTIIIFKG